MPRVFACTAGDMEKESSMAVDAGDRKIALFRNADGEFYATADSCTHEQWSLGEDSDVEGNQVTCPLHLACFDIRDGSVLCLPATEPLASYEVEVEEDDVYVVMPEP